jgi:hypothetical protein
MKSAIKALKYFGMSSRMIEHDLSQIETEYNLDLGRAHIESVSKDESYYPQIEQDIRAEAASMAPHYETFYSLEKSVRRLIVNTLKEADEKGWWLARVPEPLRTEAGNRQQREIDSGVTPRSDEPIDFLTFGELGQIIKSNWDLFASIFSSVKAVEKVMANLNMLRGPIAHCSPLAEDEILRLRLTVKDWFRLME